MIFSQVEEEITHYGKSGKPTKENPVAKLFTEGIPEELSKKMSLGDEFIISGSAGKGEWAAVPWVAIMNKKITTSTTDGYYIVLLFCEDRENVYLSLNQGVTSIRNEYGDRDAKVILKIYAEEYYFNITQKYSFTNSPITLFNRSTSSIGKYYEYGNILAKKFRVEELNSDKFWESLSNLIELYIHLIDKVGEKISKKVDHNSILGIERTEKTMRWHSFIERNPTIVKNVKKKRGYKCECCNFELAYGAIGRKFIEAHHLKPLSSYEEENIKYIELAVNDFRVLCSNCHRMIHKLDDPSDIDKLKQLIN